MPSSLEELISQLGRTQSYQPLTAEERQQQANRRYQGLYDEKRLNAENTRDTELAALESTLESLRSGYAREKESGLAQTKQSYDAANRQALTRGMQRSSYLGATLSNINRSGAQAISEIERAQSADEKQIAQKQADAQTAYARQLGLLASQQRLDELSYADTLEARDYDRQTQSLSAQNAIAMKLYEYRHQLEQEASEQARWQAEFNAKYAQSKRSGGSSSSKPKSLLEDLLVSGSVKA